MTYDASGVEFCVSQHSLLAKVCENTRIEFESYLRYVWLPSKPSVHYMYHQFNIQQFHVLPTQCIYVFCVDLRTNSHYFPRQH